MLILSDFGLMNPGFAFEFICNQKGLARLMVTNNFV